MTMDELQGTQSRARYLVAFGSWKLRHNEPLNPDEAVLRLMPLLEPPAELQRVACVVDITQSSFAQSGVVLDTRGDEEPWIGRIPDLADEVPLALVAEQDGELRLTHLLMRLAEPVAQFYRVDEQPYAALPLWQRISELNEQGHLRLSNHECYYLKDQQDIELEQKLSLDAPFPYLELCLRLRRSLADGEAPGFRAQYGDEYQFWSYDNFFYEIQPNERREAGYVSVISYCKKKRSWDDPMFMFKKKIYSEDSLERWERNFENQRVEGDKQAALRDYFGYPIAALPTWRRTRCDVAFESDAGHVFMVNFDDCRVWDAEPGSERLQQVEVEYLKTRGVPDRASIYEDFNRLVAFVEQKVQDWGFTSRRTHYSKLTFLKDYVASAPQRLDSNSARTGAGVNHP